MQTADGRYLEHPDDRTTSMPGETRVVPRDAEDVRWRGTSGRVRRRTHLPGKTWYNSYNLKAQEDTLVETYPVGLRRRRLCCVVTTTILTGIIIIIAFALLLWTVSVMQVHPDGASSFMIRSGHMLFSSPLQVTERAIIGEGIDAAGSGGAANIQPFSGDTVTLASSKTVDLVVRSAQTDGNVKLTATKSTATLQSPNIALVDAKLESFVTLRPSEIDVASTKFRVTGDALFPGSSLLASRVTSNLSSPLNVESTSTLSSTSFLETTITSRFGSVTASAKGGLLVNASNTVIRDAPITLQSATRDYRINLAALPLPARRTRAYTVCVCASGKLYLTPGDSASCVIAAPAWTTNPCA